MMDLFSEFFNIFDGMDMFADTMMSPAADKRCPTCGSTWADFNRTGKFGCGDCYAAFADNTAGVLRRIHASDTHTGKVPSHSGAEIRMKRKLQDLRRELKAAVADEDYAKAAKLHAQIKEIEGGGIK